MLVEQKLSMGNFLIARIGYILSSRVLVAGLNFVSIIIFARYLLPEDFGIFAMTISIAGLYRVFVNFFTEYLIYAKDLRSNECASFFWANIITAFFLFLITSAFKSEIVQVSKMPELGLTSTVLSFLILIESFGIQSRIEMIKSLRFKAISIVESISIIGSFVISLLIILKGYAFWGLIFKFSLDILIANSIFLFLSRRVFKFHLRFSDLYKGVSYSLPIIGKTFFVGLSLFLQNFLINNYLGKLSVGIFNQTTKLYTLPLQTVVYPIGRLAFPLLSKMKENPILFKETYLFLCQVVSIVVLPLVFFIIVFPSEVVFLILGKNWIAVIPILKGASFAVLATSIVNIQNWLFLSLGKPSKMLVISIAKLILYIAFIFMAIDRGLYFVALAISLAEFILIIPSVMWAIQGTNISILDILKSQLCGCFSALTSLLLPFLLWKYLNSESIKLFALIIIPFCVLCYLASLRYFNVIEKLKQKDLIKV